MLDCECCGEYVSDQGERRRASDDRESRPIANGAFRAECGANSQNYFHESSYFVTLLLYNINGDLLGDLQLAY
jgi:hypothetical protein